MENFENILDDMQKFEIKSNANELPDSFEVYLRHIAKTGDPVFPWIKVKHVIKWKLTNVISTFYQLCENMDTSDENNKNECKTYKPTPETILERFETFEGAPFTIQRICEMLIDPRKHYKNPDKFLRGLEKNLMVVSCIEPGRPKPVTPEPTVNGLIEDVEMNLGVDYDEEMMDENEVNSTPNGLDQPSGSGRPEASKRSIDSDELKTSFDPETDEPLQKRPRIMDPEPEPMDYEEETPDNTAESNSSSDDNDKENVPIQESSSNEEASNSLISRVESQSSSPSSGSIDELEEKAEDSPENSFTNDSRESPSGSPDSALDASNELVRYDKSEVDQNSEATATPCTDDVIPESEPLSDNLSEADSSTSVVEKCTSPVHCESSERPKSPDVDSCIVRTKTSDDDVNFNEIKQNGVNPDEEKGVDANLPKDNFDVSAAKSLDEESESKESSKISSLSREENDVPAEPERITCTAEVEPENTNEEESEQADARIADNASPSDTQCSSSSP